MRKNYQWKITKYGLETCRNNDELYTEYSIPANKLFEIVEFEDIIIFREMIILLGREWVYGDDLIEIYPFALKFHAQRLNIQIDEAKMSKALNCFKANDTYLKARDLRERISKNQITI